MHKSDFKWRSPAEEAVCINLISSWDYYRGCMHKSGFKLPFYCAFEKERRMMQCDDQ